MVIVVCLILVGLVPPVISVWASHRAKQRIVERLNRIMETGYYPAIPSWRQRRPDEHYIDGIGLMIGDITCQLNARSPHIRCAVNPMGPCDDCRSFEGRSYEHLLESIELG
ncbi:MAG: hypothetical protein F6K31_42445 [Symploca sp. SIO2G7]|nr:hypothetical protein [Symploca sp. SIO2G7]